MPYEILYAEGALDRVKAANLPDPVIDALDAAMHALAESPTRASRPTVFPYPPKGQMYHFHHDHAGIRYYFNVFFWYMADEQSLKVFAVTVATLP
jgi:hypothetical protein